MICVVRQLAIESLYKKTGNEYSPEDANIATTMALIWAYSKFGSTDIVSLSKISLPFWIVQISPENSVLLSSSSSISHEFTFKYESRLAEIRRIISNDVSEPKDVPIAVEKGLELIKTLSDSTNNIANMVSPSALQNASKLIIEVDPNARPNRIEETLHSQKALDISENIQEIRDNLLSRIDRLEELKGLSKDQLRSQLNVIENILAMEKKRWQQRLAAMEESTEVAVHDVELEKQDEIYKLKEDYKMRLRASTTDFARASSDIEDYFSGLLEHVRETRIKIAQQKDDVESAVEEYQKLSKYLTDALPSFTDILDRLSTKSAEVLKDADRYNEEFAKGTSETEAGAENRIEQQRRKLASLENERDEMLTNLEELRASVSNAIDRLEGRINYRLLDLQGNVLKLNEMLLTNASIQNLAPLTHLDISLFVSKDAKDKITVFAPSLTPMERFNLPVQSQSIDTELEDFILDIITESRNSDISFIKRYDTAISEGNLFQDPDFFKSVESGLRELQYRQLLEEGVSERVLEIAGKYSSM